jgi:hypothetical protein
MLVLTLPCIVTVAVPGVPGGAPAVSQPASITDANAAVMILMKTFRTS